MGEQRKHIHDDLFEDEIFIVSDICPQEESEDILVAQRMYSRHFGRAREHTRARNDKGVPRARGDAGNAKPVMTSFMRNIRKCIDRASAGISVGNVSATSMDVDAWACALRDAVTADTGWTDRHDEEVQFQIRKRNIARIKASMGGLAVNREVTTALEDAVAAETRRHAERRRVYALDTQRLANRTRPTNRQLQDMLRRKKVFWAALLAMQQLCVRSDILVWSSCMNAWKLMYSLFWTRPCWGNDWDGSRGFWARVWSRPTP